MSVFIILFNKLSRVMNEANLYIAFANCSHIPILFTGGSRGGGRCLHSLPFLFYNDIHSQSFSHTLWYIIIILGIFMAILASTLYN